MLCSTTCRLGVGCLLAEAGRYAARLGVFGARGFHVDASPAVCTQPRGW